MAVIVNDRIDIRVSKKQKELFRYASDVSGFKNLTEFVVYCVNKEANKIIIENNQILKSIEDKKIFIKAILDAPQPNANLKKAQLNYNKFKSSNEVKDRGIGKKIRKK
jgi:uncharacterized protein (DUF1778 family)